MGGTGGGNLYQSKLDGSIPSKAIQCYSVQYSKVRYSTVECILISSTQVIVVELYSVNVGLSASPAACEHDDILHRDIVQSARTCEV